VLLREEFNVIKQAHGDGYLDVKYFVDRVDKGTKLPDDIQQGPITEKIIRESIAGPSSGLLSWRKSKNVSPQGRVMVLVCGPDGFTKYIAGEHGGVTEKQGVKGGLLEKVEGIEVFKLLESRNEEFVQPPSTKPSKMPIMKTQ